MQELIIDIKVWLKFWLALYIFQEIVNAAN